MEDLHERLKIDGQLAGRLPARSTFYRKLNGAGLLNAGRLIDAVVRTCARDDRHADELLEQTQELLRQARHQGASQDGVKAGTSGGADDTRSELIRVQRQLIAIQADLATAVQAAAAAQKEAERARNLVAMLLALQATGAPADTGGNTTTDAEARALRARLAEAEADRDRAHRASSAAHHRLAEVEELLASRHADATEGTSSGPTPSRSEPYEWPTTRIEPDARAASNGPTASTHPGAQPAETPMAENQERIQPEDPSQKDRALEEVLEEMRRWDPDGSRMRSVIDGATDHLLDPVHTGRYTWSQLTNVEKHALAGAVGHRLRREFDLSPGERLDFNVAGHEVDVKFARRDGSWMFPPDSQGELHLVVNADDEAGIWNVGLVRVLPELMRKGSNRDGKRGLSAEGRAAIRWIHRRAPLLEHALPHMPEDVVKDIFARKTGQVRVEELFLRGVHRVVTKTDLKAVAMQADFGKRVRGARPRLAERGVLILAGDWPQGADLANRLDLPPLSRGTWMSIRLAPATPKHGDGPTVTIDGSPWRVALPDDPEIPLPTSVLNRSVTSAT
ncbi:NaeI family type II restriction endonuclease [Streptomyces sp. NPDC059897]|uniref:NaeI family type II restriction endonuclease n=1 Tax=Streptomyces sp. NPDC059897 TaxID=3346994 RepID=UPI00364639FE